MILGVLVSAVSLYDIYHNGFTLSVLGCLLLGIYIMTHEQNE